MRRIVALFRPYWGSLLFVAFFVVATSLVSLINPFLIREIMDVALPRGERAADPARARTPRRPPWSCSTGG